MRAVIFALVFAFTSLTGPQYVDAEVAADIRAGVQQTIDEQIAAFRADDAELAYSFAAPTIQRMFPTPGTFMNMVRQGYQPVYRPQSYAFGDLVEHFGQMMQSVSVIGPDGRPYTAIYTLAEIDGEWRITGCRITEPPGESA